MIIPLILSTFLLVPQWWKNERAKKHKFFTASLLLLQIWRQYRALRIPWLKYTKKNVEMSIKKLSVINGCLLYGNVPKREKFFKQNEILF